MKHIITPLSLICLSALTACGGGGSSSGESVTSPPPPVATSTIVVSQSSATFSGKQFRELPDRQRINLNYDPTDVNFVVVNVVGLTQVGEPLEGVNNNLFRTSTDSNRPEYVDVFPAFPNIEGGTYEDELTLELRFLDGTTGPRTTVDLTLVQEPTTPITVELNNPDDAIVEVTEGGPPVRIAATVNAGNAIRWKSEGSRFIQDSGSVFALSSDPETGVGSEQVDLIITPTPTLIDTLKDDGFFNLRIEFEDEDGRDNFFNVSVEVRLADAAAAKPSP